MLIRLPNYQSTCTIQNAICKCFMWIRHACLLTSQDSHIIRQFEQTSLKESEPFKLAYFIKRKHFSWDEIFFVSNIPDQGVANLTSICNRIAHKTSKCLSTEENDYGDNYSINYSEWLFVRSSIAYIVWHHHRPIN